MTDNIDIMRRAEQEAKTLLEKGLALSQAKNNGNEKDLILALDDNLQLWVEIETNLKNAKNYLPLDIQENLLKLSKFVERLTISKGLNVSNSDVACLVNINMQICKGLLASVHNNLAKEEAFSLLKCAIDLSNARETENIQDLIEALDNNMKLWVYIKTLVDQKETVLPKETCGNLIRLADYVSAKTIEVGQDMDHINYDAIESMIMTNLQISEGLITKEVA